MFYCGLLGSTCLIPSLGLRGGTGYIFLFVWILMNEPGIRICSLAGKTRAFRFVSSPSFPLELSFLPDLTDYVTLSSRKFAIASITQRDLQ